MTISWAEPANDGGAAITGYRIYRGTTSGGETLLLTVPRMTTYTDETTDDGTTYYYQVGRDQQRWRRPPIRRALGDTGGLSRARPTITSATAGNGSVALAWSTPTSGGAPITNYSVFRGTASGGETLLTTLGNVAGWTDTGLVNGTTYFYKVSASNFKGEGSRSGEASATPKGTGIVPGSPSNVAVKPNDAKGILLSWRAPNNIGSTPIVGYKIYRGTVSKGETLLATIGNVVTFTDTSVRNGTTYYYQITAVNGVGESSPSTEKSAARGNAPTAPPKPGRDGRHDQGNPQSGRRRHPTAVPASPTTGSTARPHQAPRRS